MISYHLGAPEEDGPDEASERKVEIPDQDERWHSSTKRPGDEEHDENSQEVRV